MSAKSPKSLCRHRFHDEEESQLNTQINAELNASYIYQSIAAYFDRDTVSLDGFKKFFAEQAKEEREHAQKFIDYQNKRGGRVKLFPILEPPTEFTPLSAFEKALEIEHDVYDKLLALHATADKHKDAQFTDFLESEYLEEQVDSLNEIAKYVTKIKRVLKDCAEGDDGLGIYMFDKELQ